MSIKVELSEEEVARVCCETLMVWHSDLVDSLAFGVMQNTEVDSVLDAISTVLDYGLTGQEYHEWDKIKGEGSGR